MEAPSKFLVCQYIYVYTGFLRSLEKYEKIGHFPAWKIWKQLFFGLLVWKQKIVQADLLTCIFSNISIHSSLIILLASR